MAAKKKKRKTPAVRSFSCYVDLAKAFQVIDSSSDSEEDKETTKKVLTYLAPLIDKNGKGEIYDDVEDQWLEIAVPRRYLRDTPDPKFDSMVQLSARWYSRR